MQDDVGNQNAPNAASEAAVATDANEKPVKPKPKLKYLIAVVVVAAAIAAIILIGTMPKQKSSTAISATSISTSTYATTTISSSNSSNITAQNKTKPASGIEANLSKGNTLSFSKFASYIENLSAFAYANTTSLNATYNFASHIMIATNSKNLYNNYTTNVSVMKNGTDSMVKVIVENNALGSATSYIFFINGREYTYDIINGNASNVMCANSTVTSLPSEVLLSGIFEVPYLSINPNATYVTILDIRNSTYNAFPCEYINASISGMNNTVKGIINLCISKKYGLPIYGYEAIGQKASGSSYVSQGGQYEMLAVNATIGINNTGISTASFPIKALLPAPLSTCIKAG